MPASKVHRYLQALIASGFTEQNIATNHYGLGRKALRVGLAALNSMDLLKVATLALAEWRDELNETYFLAVRAIKAQPWRIAACFGMTHAGIAADLGIKESTVKTYRSRAFDRLGINFRSQLFGLFSAAG